MISVGGIDYNDLTRNILRKLFTQDVCKQINLTGQGQQGKKKLQDTHLQKVINGRFQKIRLTPGGVIPTQELDKERKEEK